MNAEETLEHTRVIVRAVEAGWEETVAEIRRAENERLLELQARVRALTRALVVMVLTGVVAVTLGLVALSGQTARLDREDAQQDDARLAALVDRCRQSNDLATGLRKFVRRAAPDRLPLAERYFKVTPDCGRYARRLLNAP